MKKFNIYTAMILVASTLNLYASNAENDNVFRSKILHIEVPMPEPVDVGTVRRPGARLALDSGNVRKAGSFVVLKMNSPEECSFFANSTVVRNYVGDFDGETSQITPFVCARGLPTATRLYWVFNKKADIEVENVRFDSTYIKSDDDLTFKIRTGVLDNMRLLPFTFFELQVKDDIDLPLRSIRIYPANNQKTVMLNADVNFRPDEFKVEIEGINIGKITLGYRN